MAGSDLSESRVVTCFLRSEGEVLLLRRSGEVGSYPGRWGAVAGYAEGDTDQAARTEIKEEVGFEDVELVRRGRPFSVEDDSLGQRWIVHPYLFDLDRREPTLDWESTEYEWASPAEILHRETVPQLWDSYASVAPSLESIRQDREHGSSYLSLRALEVLRDRAALGTSWRELQTLAADLIDARRSMAVLRNRVNRVMYQADRDGDVAAQFHRAIKEAVKSDRRAAESAAELIRGRTVLTLSRSETVTAALLLARPRIFVAESRPGGEGVEVGLALAAGGLEVTIVPDSGIASLPPFDLVLVGADAVLPNGDVVNKVGTHAAGLVAAARSVPTYVVTSIDKIQSTDEPQLEEAEWELEVELDRWSPMFERAPSGLIAGYVTEEGLLDAAAIADWARKLDEFEAWRAQSAGLR